MNLHRTASSESEMSLDISLTPTPREGPHENQIEAAHQIIDGFVKEQPFTVIVAQMQSGKSGAYLYTGLEMLRFGLVDTIYIICGSADTELRSQTNRNVSDARKSFSKDIGTLEQTRMENADIRVFFASELNNAPLVGTRTLIIHDESHMAQSKENIPFRFYKRNNLAGALCGDFEALRKNENYILGVSATPFSEIISNKKVLNKDWTSDEESRFKDVNPEGKNFYMMESGQGYIGVTDLMREGSFHFEAENIRPDDYSHIVSVLRNNKYNNKYIIIRTAEAEQHQAMMKTIAKSTGYKYRYIFGGGSEDICIEDLDDEPDQRTIVHICGRFRMGQVLPKRNIGMVYEQSKNPNSDTILQGLVGRMCGYEGAHTDVDIYVSPKAEASIRVYVNAWSESKIDTLCQITGAMNLGPVCRKEIDDFTRTVPIKFNIDQINLDLDFGESTIQPKNVTFMDLKRLLDNNPEIIQGNPDKVSIIEQMMTSEGKPQFNKQTTHPEHFQTYDSAASAGIRANETTYYKSGHPTPFSIYGCQDGTCYLLGFVSGICGEPVASIKSKCNYIPAEVVMSDDSVLESVNGGQIITFPLEIFNNKELFKRKLRAAILRTTETHPTYIEECTKSVYGLYNKKTQKNEGIILEPSTYTIASIQEIIDSFDREFDITLKFNKGRGRQSTKYTRYSSISWD